MNHDDDHDIDIPGDPRRLRAIFRYEAVCPHCGGGERFWRHYKGSKDVVFATVEYRECGMCGKRFKLVVERR